MSSQSLFTRFLCSSQRDTAERLNMFNFGGLIVVADQGATMYTKRKFGLVRAQVRWSVVIYLLAHGE
jgi:hypothetical protein